MHDMLADLRFAVRTALKTPAFTTVAILTLTLGIGANSAIFTVVNAVLLRPLPYPDADRLVRITGDYRSLNQPDIGMSVPELDDYRARTDIFEAVAGVYPIDANLTGSDQPERVETMLVSANYFSLLGARPQLGRVFGPEDDLPGITEVAVLSDGLWRRSFGADPDVIGRKVRLDSDLYTVVGIMPPGFRHPGRSLQTAVEFWSPAGYRASPFGPPVRRAYFLSGSLARLKPGVTIEQAQARLDNLARELQHAYPNDYPERAGWTPRVLPLQDDLVGRIRPALLVMLGAVGFVLLIACVNIANLLLARASTRQREVAIRRALGAGRRRLIRQLLTESLTLSVTGGILATLTSLWLVDFLVSVSPASLPRLSEVRFDSRVLLFTLGVSIATGLLFGLAPALQASNPDLVEHLKEGSRGAGIGARQNRLRSLLVVTEFALAVVLLVGAGLLIRSFWRLQQVDLGFDTHNVLIARTWLPQPNIPSTGPYFDHEKRVVFVREVLRRIGALPGVKTAGAVSLVPLGGPAVAGRQGTAVTIEGRPAESATVTTARATLATSGYFHAMGIRLLSGRLISDQDDERALRVVVISDTMARRYWPNENPIGQRVHPGDARTEIPWSTIVGIVGDVRGESVDVESRPQMYASMYQVSTLQLGFAVRGASDPSALGEAVRQEVRSVDRDIPVFGIRTMDETVAAALAQRRFSMRLLGVFAAVALLLASIGIYGVMAYVVTQRGQEIGIRMALGARPSDVVRLILKQGLLLSMVGIAIGLGGAASVTRAMSTLLYQTSATDPATFAAISLLLALVGLAACLIPARRAARVDPIRALRCE